MYCIKSPGRRKPCGKKQKGFTLVELIVVLVILSILAALLVPSLTGYIEKTHKTEVVAETRAITQAAQTELNMVYATDAFQNVKQATRGENPFVVAKKTGAPELPYSADTVDGAENRYNDIVRLSEVAGLQNGKGGRFFVWAYHSGVVQFTVYDSGKGYLGVYCAEDGGIEAIQKEKAVNTDYLLESYGDKLFVQKRTGASVTAGEEIDWMLGITS